MDYIITTDQQFIDRVNEYFALMKQAKFEKCKPYPDQGDFWYHYGKVKDSIQQYAKKHSTI